MKRYLFLAALVATAPLAAPAQQPPALDSNLQKFSYAMGYRLARDLAQQGMQSVDAAALALGVEEALGGQSFRFSPDEMRAVVQAYREEALAARAAEADTNKQAGDAFMQGNASADGVQSLDTGVQYKVLEAGSGETPADGAKVRVHYTGTLLDGTEFDSSRKRGEPTELALGDVIPGWQHALTRMPVGARWMVWIPPEHAYGMRGAGNVIGPNETLVFDIELIDIVDEAPAAPAAPAAADAPKTQ